MENLEQFVRDEAKAAAQSAVVSVIGKKKKRAKKRARKRAQRAVLYCSVAAGLLCTGFMLGVHRNVIKARLTGSPMPELPEGHPRFCADQSE